MISQEEKKRMWMSSQNKIALRGVMVALAMIFSYIESLVPYPIPGIKLGLTNIVVLFALYKMGAKDAIAINFVRIVLVGLTFGNLFSLTYSLAGGMLSAAVMIVMKKTDKFSVNAVSVAGGIMHNVGQIAVAMFVLQTKAIAFYLPFLWVSGIGAGVIVGLVGKIVIERIPDKIIRG